MQLIVGDVAVRYEEEGTGPVALLLHGWGANLHTWDVLTNDLTNDGWRVLRLDLPGFGKSEMPKSAWSVSDYAAFVHAFLDKLGIAQLRLLVGHSFGGRIALKGVATRVFSPEKLILIGSAGVPEERTAKRRAFGILAKLGKAVSAVPPFSFFRDRLRRTLYEAAGSTDYLNAGPLRDTFLKVIGEDLTHSAKAITIPTLLIWGEDDAETPLHRGRVLHECIHGSTLEVISDAGHFVHQEKPAEVARAVAVFLSS